MLNYKTKVWWENLTDKEQELLIETLFNIDLSEIGIIKDKKTGEYKQNE